MDPILTPASSAGSLIVIQWSWIARVFNWLTTISLQDVEGLSGHVVLYWCAANFWSSWITPLSLWCPLLHPWRPDGSCRLFSFENCQALHKIWCSSFVQVFSVIVKTRIRPWSLTCPPLSVVCWRLTASTIGKNSCMCIRVTYIHATNHVFICLDMKIKVIGTFWTNLIEILGLGMMVASFLYTGSLLAIQEVLKRERRVVSLEWPLGSCIVNHLICDPVHLRKVLMLLKCLAHLKGSEKHALL